LVVLFDNQFIEPFEILKSVLPLPPELNRILELALLSQDFLSLIGVIPEFPPRGDAFEFLEPDFLGRDVKDTLRDVESSCSTLIPFPSILQSWGLPPVSCNN
jgi:hypothetical protein